MLLREGAACVVMGLVAFAWVVSRRRLVIQSSAPNQSSSDGADATRAHGSGESSDSSSDDSSEDGSSGDEIDPFSRIQRALSNGTPMSEVVIKGMSALNYACSLYEEELAVKMVRTGVGVDLNEAGNGGHAPLHMACVAGLTEVVEALICAKADLEVRTQDLRVVAHYESGGRTPLHVSCAQGNERIVELLLAAGANIRARDFDGNTPFIVALMSKQDASFALVQEKSSGGADSGNQDTPRPSWEWLQAKIKQDRASAARRSTAEPEGVFREVKVLERAFTVAECTRILRWATAYTEQHGWTRNRHRAYATTDIQASDIPKLYVYVRERVRERIFPWMGRQYYGAASRVRFTFRDLFLVQYDACGQKQLDMHRDGSVLSFNVLLNPASEFDGGGTFFEHTGRNVSGQQGDCVAHSGKVRHGGTAISRGRRYLLVGFIDALDVAADEYDPDQAYTLFPPACSKERVHVQVETKKDR